MKYITYLCLCGLLLVGCKDEISGAFQYNIKLDPVAVDQPEYESIVKGVEYIPLETTKKSLIGEVVDLYAAEGKIFINSDRKKVLCFDKEGRFLFNIGRRGRGHGEYVSPFSISVDNGIIYILCQHTGRLLCYDVSDGKYLKSITLQNNYMQAVVHDGFIYAVDMVLKQFAIDAIPLDNPLKRTEIYSAAKGESVYSSFRQLFKSSEGGCYWVDPLRGRVYELEDGRMNPFIDIDFGSKEYSENSLMAGEYVNNNEMVSNVRDFYRIGDKCVLSFMGGDKDMHTLLIDLKQGTTTNIGALSYNKVQFPETVYKYRLGGIRSADNRFYSYRLSVYHDECGELPPQYASYARMKGLDPSKDNITIVAFDL